MSKEKRSGPPAADLKLLPKLPPKPPTPATGDEVYAFPTKSRCPKCNTLNTLRRGDNGATQYRECASSLCRHKYSVIGVKV